MRREGLLEVAEERECTVLNCPLCEAGVPTSEHKPVIRVRMPDGSETTVTVTKAQYERLMAFAKEKSPRMIVATLNTGTGFVPVEVKHPFSLGCNAPEPELIHKDWCLIDKPECGPVHCTCGARVPEPKAEPVIKVPLQRNPRRLFTTDKDDKVRFTGGTE